MQNNTTFIYSKVIKNPTQEFETNIAPNTQDATGAGLWLIKKDAESCDPAVQDNVITVDASLDFCYSIDNIINLVP